MKSGTPAAAASGIPIIAGEPVVVQQRKIPLAVKVADTAFLAVLVPVYWLYGFNDQQPQTGVNQNLYVILWLGALWLGAFLPTHLALRKIFAAPQPATGEWPQTAHFPL